MNNSIHGCGLVPNCDKSVYTQRIATTLLAEDQSIHPYAIVDSHSQANSSRCDAIERKPGRAESADTEEETERGEGSVYSSYGLKLSKYPLKTSTRILDFISMCFWKCSPGCQEIP
ncbi:hypothetical protein PPYR_08065 [Photinus pyralis]|uniref:Uncharacterized protein n=1 Tax=Photinus pyralis TaxID=7054 RepID=A0A5N4AIC6_PHOPY|nr:hypothetical protein PPYR_08065 [Photinus pyralis]